ncbi:hypothetical protein PSTG_14278 [Puccinia striiformis f. sp. tritici PST-78]|uniref:Uncharacterized protein n=1 Tax=Puccinia striiformis f. sp. tritici PST-78 TaxID=1165861 RepID=A0A0L0UZ67_9BASI|nr:hypothetical protein PSTG_14278 [Puccinia striiformis f. sp. tritici PST-78]
MSDQETRRKANRVDIYGSWAWDEVLGFITRMIDQAHHTQSQPIRLDDHRQLSFWKLVTKYYEALLEVQYYPIETVPATTDRSTQAQAIVILWKTGEKNRLLSVLDSLNSNSNEHNTSHSRIVIVDADSEEELEEWNEICFENGFECHSSSDLSEASMSWQCCPWPSIQRKPQSTTSHRAHDPLDHTQSSSSTLVNPHPSSPENHVGFGNDFAETISGGMNQVTNPDLVNQDPSLISPDSSGPCTTGPVDNGFEDGFSDFVSAQTSSSTRWDDDLTLNKHEDENDEDDEEKISSDEVEEMVRKLFGQNDQSSLEAEGLGDLECLISQLDLLKLEAANMDHRSRKRLAAQVAMAVESQLGSE